MMAGIVSYAYLLEPVIKVMLVSSSIYLLRLLLLQLLFISCCYVVKFMR